MSLITTPRLHRLWEDAQIHPEWATTRLWEYIFNHIIFSDDKWVVSSQQPPTHQPGELRRVDLVVEKMDSNAATVSTLLFVEAKRASASPSEIEQVEYQAFTAACAYSIETGAEYIWAMTCFGSRVRLWIFSSESIYLIPFIPPGETLAERSEYMEISTHGRQIADGLEYIKGHPTPPKKLLKMPPSPRPPNAALPSGWHDEEVSLLDAHRRQDAVPDPIWDNAMDFEAGPSSSTTTQLQQEAGDWLGHETSASAAVEGPQDASVNQLEPEDYPETEDYHHDPGSSEGHKASREVEVRVTRISHTFRKDELHFDRKGHTQSSTEEDWVKGKRNGRTVWVYRHAKKTVYWTKKLG